MNLAYRVTNIGASYKGQAMALGRCWRLSHFQLGTNGVDPTGLPYSVDVARTGLVSPITPLLDISAFGTITAPGPRRLLVDLMLDASTGNGVFSQLGVFGEIIYCDEPGDAGLVGTRFLYGLCNFSEVNKNVGDTRRLTFTINTAL